MDLSALTTKDFQVIAEDLHRRFNDNMYSRFGLRAHPGYYKVEVGPFLLNGMTYIDEFNKTAGTFISDPSRFGITQEKYNSFIFTCAHESAHLLHHNIWVPPREVSTKAEKQRNWYLAELVSDYASLLFFRDFQPDFFETSKKQELSGLAKKLFDKDPNLLQELAHLKPEQMTKWLFDKIPQSNP